MAAVWIIAVVHDLLSARPLPAGCYALWLSGCWADSGHLGNSRVEQDSDLSFLFRPLDILPLVLVGNAVMLKKMVGKGESITSSSKIDLSKLPPCHRSLVPHIKRVNYRAAQWKRSHMKVFELLAPTDHGWTLSKNLLQPVWSDEPVMPSTLIGGHTRRQYPHRRSGQ